MNKIYSLIFNLIKKKSLSLDKIVVFLPKVVKEFFGIYPRIVAHEIKQVKKVLKSRQWNMGYGSGLVHEKYESKFCETVGSNYAVAFGTGGVAMQTLFRALDIKLFSKIAVQVDTCSASVQAILNVNLSPELIDVNLENFMLNLSDLEVQIIDNDLSGILATHMWGNTENLDHIINLAKGKNIHVIEDACLAFGSKIKNKHVGTFGVAGIFSTGSTKPIQTGEGGMVVTNDYNLYQTLKEMRSWGDNYLQRKTSNFRKLSFNGRMSEVVAAIGFEQLIGYEKRLKRIQENVEKFISFLSSINEIEVVLGYEKNVQFNSFNQVVLKLDEKRICKESFRKFLDANGIFNYEANFPPIIGMDFFQKNYFLNALPQEISNNINLNKVKKFNNSYLIYNSKGIGLSRINFESSNRVQKIGKLISNNLKFFLK